MTVTCDVLIIGAGVVGCSIARSLAREGLATLNVDALPAAGYGSTSHSSAIVRPFYSHVTAAAVAHEARARWLEWAEFLEAPRHSTLAHYTESGGLVLVRAGEEAALEGNLSVLREIGVEYQELDADGVSALYPGICLDTFGPPKRLQDDGFGEATGGHIAGGILIPAAGYVSDPQLAARNLMEAAQRAGARFMFNARVDAIEQSAGVVTGVLLADGSRVSAGAVINAAGPHSSAVNDLVGLARVPGLHTRAERHEVAYVPAPTGYVEHGNGFVFDLDAGVYTRADGVDLLVGTADPPCDEPGVTDPDTDDGAFTEQWTVQVYRAAQRFPKLDIPGQARGTVGIYDVSADWIPIYDKTDLAGYFVAIGTSGNQFKNAPVIGDLMASILGSSRAGVDHDTQPATLRLPHLSRTVDLSFYSRHREIQQTRSVMA